MKDILLMRHAKSSWDDARLHDIERPLSERGRRDAPVMGSFIKKIGYIPGHIVSSTARRAKDTAQLVAQALNIDPSAISWDEQLYYGSFEDYVQSIRTLPDNIDRAMIVGHNPLIEQAASGFCSKDANFFLKVPTGGLICLEHVTDRWDEFRPGTAHVKWMMVPGVVRKLF